MDRKSILKEEIFEHCKFLYEAVLLGDPPSRFGPEDLIKCILEETNRTHPPNEKAIAAFGAGIALAFFIRAPASLGRIEREIVEGRSVDLNRKFIWHSDELVRKLSGIFPNPLS